MNFNESGSKYLRAVPCITDGKIDVYAVLDAFDVTCPARQHAIKKLLCSGTRGKGDILQDLRESRDAVTRAIQMEEQRGFPPTIDEPYEPWPDPCAAAIADVRRDMEERDLCTNCYDNAKCGGVFLTDSGECQQERLEVHYLHGHLCPSCARTDCAKGQYPATKDGGCEGYIKAEKESLCVTCFSEHCMIVPPSHVDSCTNYVPKEEPKAESKALLCDTCNAKGCPKEMMAECDASGQCALYLPAANASDAEQDAPTAADLPLDHADPSTNCKDCFNSVCVGKGRNLTCDQVCERFIPKEASL